MTRLRLGWLCLVVLVALSPLTASLGQAMLSDGRVASASPQATEERALQSVGLNRSVQELSAILGRTPVGDRLADKRVNVRVSTRNGSVAEYGVRFTGGEATVRNRQFADAAYTLGLPETALDSILDSESPGIALSKAIEYDLVRLRGSGVGRSVGVGIGQAAAGLDDEARSVVWRVDIDSDGTVDSILDIEGLDTDDDGTFDETIKTVFRDTDGDGEMDTVTSRKQTAVSSVAGIATVDVNDDGFEETRLRLRGVDEDRDGRFDRREQTTIADRNGDRSFESFARRLAEIQPSRAVTGDWDLTEDGTVDVRIQVNGTDDDGDGWFDRQTVTVFLNLDDQPGFESRSSTTSRTTPTLSVAATFDTDGDGTAETEARFQASDQNGDGGLESTTKQVVVDEDGDGSYERVESFDRSQRGFFTNSGAGPQLPVVNNPGNLTLIGVIASVMGMLRQLIQGG
jgi:hypothetical protein